MIKNYTISKNKIVKILPAEYKKLDRKFQEACELIRQSINTIGELNLQLKEKDEEIKRLKSHWLYRFINWFK